MTRVLVERLGRPITSTSANLPRAAPATSAEEALGVAAEMAVGAELWVLDAGRLAPSPPSTVVDCTGPHSVVIRVGATPVQRLRCVLPEIHGEP